jgi:cytochrome c-type biogenesis protein CcmE
VKRNKLIAIIGIAISVIVIGTLLVINIRPYLGVTQIISGSSSYDNQEVQVIGIVQDFNGENFSLTENTYSLSVDAKGTAIPPELQNGIKIVVTGIFSSSPMVLIANQILVQCS